MVGRRPVRWGKLAAHAAVAAPLAWLAWRFLGDRIPGDATEYVTLFTGFGALRLLVLSLAVTPLRRLVPGLAWLGRYRRMLGLWACAYATVHLLVWVVLFAGGSVAAMLDDARKHRYIFPGLASWAIMLPLAATSTAWAIGKLGGKRWARLHRLAYLAGLAALVHAWWSVKPETRAPVVVATVVLFALLAVRVVWVLRRHGAQAG